MSFLMKIKFHYIINHGLIVKVLLAQYLMGSFEKSHVLCMHYELRTLLVLVEVSVTWSTGLKWWKHGIHNVPIGKLAQGSYLVCLCPDYKKFSPKILIFYIS